MNLCKILMLTFVGTLSAQSFSSNQHILRITPTHIESAPSWDVSTQYPLELQAKWTGAKWTDVSASTNADLREKLIALAQKGEFDKPITHILFAGHGGPSDGSVFMNLEKESVRFKAGNENNPLKLLRGHTAPYVKIFLGGCNVFNGSVEQVETRARQVGKATGIKEFEVFGADENYGPMLNLFPPLRPDSNLPGRLKRLTCMSATIYALICTPFLAFYRDRAAFYRFLKYSPLSLYSFFLFSVGANLAHGVRHEGYLVRFQNGKASVDKLGIDTYRYEQFLSKRG